VRYEPGTAMMYVVVLPEQKRKNEGIIPHRRKQKKPP
jgi:hypothetical protein